MSAWQVTVKAGLKDVVLPNGIRYQGGANVVLSDDEVSRMSPTSFATVFNNVLPIQLNSLTSTLWAASEL